MKIVRKYATMTLLLFSVAAIVPNKAQTPWYNKQVQIGNTTTTIGTVAGNIAVYAGFIALLAYSFYHEKKLGIPLIYRDKNILKLSTK